MVFLILHFLIKFSGDIWQQEVACEDWIPLNVEAVSKPIVSCSKTTSDESKTNNLELFDKGKSHDKRGDVSQQSSIMPLPMTPSTLNVSLGRAINSSSTINSTQVVPTSLQPPMLFPRPEIPADSTNMEITGK